MHSLLAVLRVLGVLSFAGILMVHPRTIAYAQYGGDCSSYSTSQDCCDDSGCCTNNACANNVTGMNGSGTQTIQNQTLSCSPVSNCGSPCSCCVASSSVYVPVDNGNCCASGGYPCNSDNDCCGGMICPGGLCVACSGDGGACRGDSDCCGSDVCSFGTCTTPSSCADRGQYCDLGTDCCDDLECIDGTCEGYF